VGDFNIPLSLTDRTYRQNINKNIIELNNTMDEMNLTDIYRVFHSLAADCNFSQQPMELSPKQIIS
jgi:hypothetical protein